MQKGDDACGAFCDLGDRLARALLTGDFPLHAEVMAIPLRIVPLGGQACVPDSPSALQHDFDLCDQTIRTVQMTDIYREVQAARAEDGGRVRVFRAVHIFVRAHWLTDPFRSGMPMVPGTAGLRIAEVVRAVAHIDWTLGRRAIGPTDGLI